MIGFYGICSLICAWPLLLIFGISGIENFADAAEFWYICIGFSFAILGLTKIFKISLWSIWSWVENSQIFYPELKILKSFDPELKILKFLVPNQNYKIFWFPGVPNEKETVPNENKNKNKTRKLKKKIFRKCFAADLGKSDHIPFHSKIFVAFELRSDRG